MAGPGAVYSKRFCAAWGVQASQPFTVPQGKTAVVKSILAANNNTTPGVVAIVVDGAQIWNLSVPGNSGANVGGIMLVLNAGETISCLTQFQYMFIAVSGYLLGA